MTNLRSLNHADETLPLVLTGRAPWRTEVESGRVTVSLRAIPITRAGTRPKVEMSHIGG